MALEEYGRKRRFDQTPEPPPKLARKAGNRFVVQRHSATRLHYDFRLEMEGVLKSWAVPKGPSLDPADKRLAMHVEDHPVSYFDFEGIIPPDNYGAGTVMVWDVGTWQPLSPVPVNGKYVPTTEAEAATMIAKGDLKFRLNGKRLKGDFALIKMRGRRPGSKGNEWLMIKKHDDHVVEGYDIEGIEDSVLSGRTLGEIAGDSGSKEWTSRATGGGKLKAAWLADAVARLDQKKKGQTTTTAGTGKQRVKPEIETEKRETKKRETEKRETKKAVSAKQADVKAPVSPVSSVVKVLSTPTKRPMPSQIHPMLAESVEKPFDGKDWLFEIKWDGYRAVAFIANGKTRLVSRNQNDLTARYPELKDLAKSVQAGSAILDGEVVALDEQGRPSFSLMQQRTGFRPGGRKAVARADVPVVYYAFDLLYLDGFDWRRMPLEDRKAKLKSVLRADDLVRYSDHQEARGVALFEMAAKTGLEGILAKKRASLYVEKRTTDWLKIKIRHRLEAVIGGYTEPEGSRAHFGSIVLGLYDKKGHLVHIGQAGSGFDQRSLDAVWKLLQARETKKSPFHGEVEALRRVNWVKPELVAEIEFADWTGGAAGASPKLRAPVFLGLRDDKEPRECVL